MRVLAVSAHPDDETLGCGGTLLKHRARGNELFWIVVTQAFPPRWPDHTVERKLTEVQRVSEAYGITETFRLGFRASELDQVPKGTLIETIDRVIRSVRPSWIYTVGNHDVHSDHLAVFEALMIGLKPFKSRGVAERIMTYEILSSTDGGTFRGNPFAPQVYSDITPYLAEKVRVMGLYETEHQPAPLPRSGDAIAALARYRGSAIGVEFAEAFMLVREIF